MVTTKEMLPILKLELDSLIREGGVYYSAFDKLNDPEAKILVLYFDDSLIDLMAEFKGVKCRMSNFDVLAEFKCYASDMFEQFNSRQTHSIIMRTLEDHMDLGYMEKSKVITQHFPMHSNDGSRVVVMESWLKYRFRLVLGMIFSGF